VARIIQIPQTMSLSAALKYFSNELPEKEAGWIELFGTASEIQTEPDHFIRATETFNITNCVCLLMGTKTTITATISETNGAIIYSGPIHDFTSESIEGRITMLPQNKWTPPRASMTPKAQQNTKATVSLEANAMSWGDLAQMSKQQTLVSEPQSTPTKESIDKKTTASFAVGDVMMHPRFGRCKIVRAPSFGKVKIRKPSGSFADLHLKVIQIVRVERSNAGRLFHVEIGPATSAR
jgi:hypothetical protein